MLKITITGGDREGKTTLLLAIGAFLHQLDTEVTLIDEGGEIPVEPEFHKHLNLTFKPLVVEVPKHHYKPFDPLEECDPDVFRFGEVVGIFDMPKEDAEAMCKGLTQSTGRKHDWHFSAGRVVVKAIPLPKGTKS